MTKKRSLNAVVSEILANQKIVGQTKYLGQNCFKNLLAVSNLKVEKKITVALIKPDVVANEEVDEIVEKIEGAGIEIVLNEEKMLTVEEASEFYKNKESEEYFNDLISYVTSGPCRVLVLTKGGTGEGVLESWRDIIGPFDAALAKEEKPNSLRAIYGENVIRNALHGSNAEDDVLRELHCFLPDFKMPTYTVTRIVKKKPQPNDRDVLETTLAFIRHDAISPFKDDILAAIGEAGFKVVSQRLVEFTKEEAEELYGHRKDEHNYPELIEQTTRGPCLAMCLAADDAVNKWKQMLGPAILSQALDDQPDCLRAKFRLDDVFVDMLHGSETAEGAQKELRKLFDEEMLLMRRDGSGGKEKTLALIRPRAVSSHGEAIVERINEAGFQIVARKEVAMNTEEAADFYSKFADQERFQALLAQMTGGPSLALCLSAYDAVEKWKTMLGPYELSKATKEQPDCLRAQFQVDGVEVNMLHGSESFPVAQSELLRFFTEKEISDEREEDDTDKEEKQTKDTSRSLHSVKSKKKGGKQKKKSGNKSGKKSKRSASPGKKGKSQSSMGEIAITEEPPLTEVSKETEEKTASEEGVKDESEGKLPEKSTEDFEPGEEETPVEKKTVEFEENEIKAEENAADEIDNIAEEEEPKDVKAATKENSADELAAYDDDETANQKEAAEETVADEGETVADEGETVADEGETVADEGEAGNKANDNNSVAEKVSDPDADADAIETQED